MHNIYPKNRGLLQWNGYIYGGLCHSAHTKYTLDLEERGEQSVRRGLTRIGVNPDTVRGLRVLDVGSGINSFGFNRLGAVVEHHDIARETVNNLNEYAARMNYTNITSHITDLCYNELPAEYFDIIYLDAILPIVSDGNSLLRNIARALKTGGYCYLSFNRSGRWYWFVGEVLRMLADRSMLFDALARFADMTAIGNENFKLRQIEEFVDIPFMEEFHNHLPSDVLATTQALGLEPTVPFTSMNCVDEGIPTDHSLFFAHLFNTVGLRKTSAVDYNQSLVLEEQCQLTSLEGLGGSYDAVRDVTAEYLFACEAGKFSRDRIISHIINLWRMMHPSLPNDIYFVPGVYKSEGTVGSQSDAHTMAKRHSLWVSFLTNVLKRESPLPDYPVESLGYELARYIGGKI